MTDWLVNPSASAVAATARATAAGKMSLDLPPLLSPLPYLFRMMALAFFMPVILLAMGDCLGWAFFKLILRPLGYSSVCVSTGSFADHAGVRRLVAGNADARRVGKADLVHYQ